MIDKEAFKEHTPGKWKLSNPSGGCYEIRGRDQDNECVLVADVFRMPFPHDGEQRANATLIAAAPDLLAENSALEESVRELVSALERTLSNFRAILAQKPVRDASETIAEAESVLAKHAAGRKP